MRIVQTIVIASATMAMLLVSYIPAEAAEYRARRLTYANDGAYSACVSLRWKDSDGKKRTMFWDAKTSSWMTLGRNTPCLMKPNNSTSVTLNTLAEQLAKNPDGKQLEEGNEVWLRIEIEAGETKSCRKDKTRFYYYADGVTPRFKTAGTTYNNNRCKIVSKK